IAGFALGIGQLPGLTWSILLMTLAVATMGFGNGVVFQVVSDRFPKQIGLASGLIGAAGSFGGFLLPTWLGWLKDATGTYQSGFFLFAGLSVAAAMSVAVAMQRKRLAAQGCEDVAATVD
ncbi:MAG: hypothetical protein HY205_01060, partial [Nitrospirae bacterium]|nr:hypothetical protein [Nitrospirota bacterium]